MKIKWNIKAIYWHKTSNRQAMCMHFCYRIGVNKITDLGKILD